MVSEPPFPRAKAPRLRKTGGPGTQIEFAMQFKIFRSFPDLQHPCTRSPLPSNLCLIPSLHYKKCSQTCSRHKLFLVKQTGGKCAYLFRAYSRARNSKRPQDVSIVFDHPRHVRLHLMKTLCVVATFDYVIG